MANLSWGRPTIKLVKLVDGEIPTTPTYIDVEGIVAESTVLTATKGTKREAPLEGGGFADVAYGKSTYQLVFELYAIKGATKPVADDDGVILDHYAVFLQPEDPTVEGIEIPKSVLSVEDTYSAQIGKKWKYTADVLQPESGPSVLHKVVTFPTTSTT